MTVNLNKKIIYRIVDEVNDIEENIVTEMIIDQEELKAIFKQEDYNLEAALNKYIGYIGWDYIEAQYNIYLK